MLGEEMVCCGKEIEGGPLIDDQKVIDRINELAQEEHEIFESFT